MLAENQYGGELTVLYPLENGIASQTFIAWETLSTLMRFAAAKEVLRKFKLVILVFPPLAKFTLTRSGLSSAQSVSRSGLLLKSRLAKPQTWIFK